MTREVILDTETTGMDPASHRVIEIGCVEMVSGVRTQRTFQAYINPECDIPEEATRVHGLTLEFLSDKPTFAEIVDGFLEFIQDSPLVIHNAGFNLKFLNAELSRLGFPAIPMNRATDTVLIARKKFPGSPANLDALCKRFNIDLSARTKHGALLDAELLSEVYVELLGGKQAALALELLSPKGEGAQAQAASAQTLEPRIFSPSEEEAAAHAQMLKKLKKPLWAA